MFSTVRYFIKTAIGFLILGLLTGAFMMISKNIFHQGYPYSMITAHTHLILIGFVMMMIMGVAIWFFPRPEKEDKKYNPTLILIVYEMITISTFIRFVSEIINGYLQDEISAVIITLASLGQLLSFMLFFYSIWGRIRPIGSHIREAKGEKF
ncbi:MAG: hypothetical protein AB1695_01355 [Stygiobacter sp.]|jgi:cbb3-type cytochrome oxidase subunit 1